MECGITFAMGYTWRFNAGAQTIKALLEAGAIDPVRYARGGGVSKVEMAMFIPPVQRHSG